MPRESGAFSPRPLGYRLSEVAAGGRIQLKPDETAVFAMLRSRALELMENWASSSGTFFVQKQFMNIENLQRKQTMRIYLAIAVVSAMISTFAAAQPANRDANTPAVNTPNTPPNPGAPAAGANSFTEGQAKSRI